MACNYGRLKSSEKTVTLYTTVLTIDTIIIVVTYIPPLTSTSTSTKITTFYFYLQERDPKNTCHTLSIYSYIIDKLVM